MLREVISTAALVTIGLSASANAATLAYDGFDYSAASNTNGQGTGFGFGGNYISDGGNGTVLSGSLTPPSGTGVVTANNSVQAGGRSGRYVDNTAITGPFAAYLNGSGNVGLDGTTIYLGVLINENGSLFSRFEVSRPNTGETGIRGDRTTFRFNGGYAQIGESGSGTGLTNDDTNSPVDFIVARISYVAGNDTVDFFRNRSTDVGQTPDGTLTGDFSFRYFSLGGFDGNNPIFDEIRVGTDFASVVPEPASLALLGLGGLMMGRRRRIA